MKLISDLNRFGLKKYHPRDIIKDEKIASALRSIFRSWFNHLGIKNSEDLINSTFDSLNKYSTKTGLIEENLRDKYKSIISKIKSKKYNISPFAKGNILKVNPGEDFQYRNNQFDTSLLLNVLHHCLSPLFKLEEAMRVTKGNIIILEPVYGITKKDTPKEIQAKNPKFYSQFHKLDKEQQRKYCAFIDWFLNKLIIGNQATCPGNFNSCKNWEDIFKSMGLKIIYKKTIGMNITPEYHMLYILRK